MQMLEEKGFMLDLGFVWHGLVHFCLHRVLSYATCGILEFEPLPSIYGICCILRFMFAILAVSAVLNFCWGCFLPFLQAFWHSNLFPLYWKHLSWPCLLSSKDARESLFFHPTSECIPSFLQLLFPSMYSGFIVPFLASKSRLYD